MPDFSLENEINDRVCGIDEVGRGPLAGPVVAGCVYIPEEVRALNFIAKIKDSKKLSEKKLAELDALIREHCIWAIAECSPADIDEVNILQASLLAMKSAFEQMNNAANITHALIDGNHCPNLTCAMTAVIKGDDKSTSIAAASILAKTYRDGLMKNLAIAHPHYGWDTNVGYPSRQHLEAINVHGITLHHRKSFAPIRNYMEFGTIKPPLSKAS